MPEISPAPLRYTRLPRPTLWLVPEGVLSVRGPGGTSEVLEIQAFYISRAPVTQAELDAFLPDRVRDPRAAAGEHPAVQVSYHEAEGYGRRVAELSGKPFRLPTADEWEYACRAGSPDRCFWGEDPRGGDAHAWHAGNSAGICPRVETRKGNRFGLYDMLGTVWEWTSSRDAAGPEARVCMGGAFTTPAAELASSARLALDPATRRVDLGFRVARSLGP